MKDKNRDLVANFMGWKDHPKSKDHYITTDKHRKVPWYVCGVVLVKEDFRCDEQWEWLMSVVEKIESLGYDFEIRENTCSYRFNDGESHFYHCNTKIEAVYRAVVGFITWYYNNEKQKN